MKYVILILSLTIIFGCSKNSDPFSVNNEESYFCIYFLKDTTMTEQETTKMDINSLVLNDDPWLTHNDIEFYDFSTHCIYLKKDKSYFFENYGGKFYQFNPELISRPFVIVAGNERCYVGALHSGLLSMAPAGPYMNELDVGYFPADVMHISRAWSDDEDIRSNPKVEEVLIEQDLFHAGLEIELTSFQLVDNSDTSTVEYSIKIKNNDQDNLYIIDPAKMGSELFHYYTNGPHLWDYSKPLYLYSQFKEVDSPEPYDSWNFEWFTLVKSNQSIERTILLKGYPHIPNGNYVGYMNFSNPTKITKENRYVADSRIWIGSIRSNDFQIMIQE
jgi:hypothetical protein